MDPRRVTEAERNPDAGRGPTLIMNHSCGKVVLAQPS